MSSTTTRPPRTPGALVADAVADLADAAARLAQLTAEGALVEVPGEALARMTETMHRAGDRLGAVSTLSTGVVHSSGVLTVEGFADSRLVGLRGGRRGRSSLFQPGEGRWLRRTVCSRRSR